MSIDKNIQHTVKLAEQVCQQKGRQLTQKRRQVLTLLLLTDKAISAYELIELFEMHFDKILTPMTAYRSLDFLNEMHLAHRLNTANKYIACAHIGSDISHQLPHFLICQQCLRVDELTTQTSSSLNDINYRAQEFGYQLCSPQIELNCICNSCLTENASQTRPDTKQNISLAEKI